MRTHVGIVLTARPSCEQTAAMRRNAGAARFAWNWCVARFAAQSGERAKRPEHKMLYSAFDFINGINQWKVSALAGYSDAAGVGLPWRKEVSAHVMEESAADCGKAVQAFFKSIRERKAKKTKRVVGPPQFEDRFGAKQSFRLRNTDGKRYRVTKKGVTVPVIGYL